MEQRKEKPEKQGAAQVLKAERLKRGISRRQMDRLIWEKATKRPAFWWVQK